MNEAIQQLQATIGQLSQAAATEFDQQKLDAALSAAHNLLTAAQQAAEAANVENVKKFLQEMASLLQQLKAAAPAAVQEKLDNILQPEVLLERLTGAYSTYIQPMINEAQDIAQTNAVTASELQRWGAIASLGIEVFQTCAEITRYHKDMTPREKVYAMTGTVLMVAGVGLLVAATVNPHIGIPVIAALTIVTLGCYLAQKALMRFKNQPVHESLYKVSEQIDNTATTLNIGNYPKRLLTFRPSPGQKVKAESEEPKTSFGNTIINGLRKLFGGGS